MVCLGGAVGARLGTDVVDQGARVEVLPGEGAAVVPPGVAEGDGLGVAVQAGAGADDGALDDGAEVGEGEDGAQGAGEFALEVAVGDVADVEDDGEGDGDGGLVAGRAVFGKGIVEGLVGSC